MEKGDKQETEENFTGNQKISKIIQIDETIFSQENGFFAIKIKKKKDIEISSQIENLDKMIIWPRNEESFGTSFNKAFNFDEDLEKYIL